MAKNEKPITTYVDEELYRFFTDVIVPKYDLGAAGALRWLLAQERRRIENNATKEHALEVLQQEMVELQDAIRHLRAQNEILMYAVMGILVRIKAEPVIVDGNPVYRENEPILQVKLGEDIVQEMRELVRTFIKNG